MEHTEVRLTKVPEELWRRVREKAAALRGMKIRDWVLEALASHLEREL